MVRTHTAAEKRPQPLLAALSGSFRMSSSEGAFWEERAKDGWFDEAGGSGVLPKPAYFPPVKPTA